MNPRPIVTCIITLAIALLPAIAGAQSGGHIRLESVAQMEQEVFNTEGKKVIQRVPAAKVVPGSEVIFTIRYRNDSAEPAQNAVITNPVPEHMVYKAGSAAGSGTTVTYSVDGGNTFDIAEKLFVYDAAGRAYPARAKDYTHIRWTFAAALSPQAKGEVSFRAILQ